MDRNDQMTVTFRCPPELEPILPRPIPAVIGMPEWFKALPQKAFSAVLGDNGFTVKKCPPFIDAMTYGFLIPLAADLTIENGEFSWNFGVAGAVTTDYSHSPIDFHDPSQVAGTPFFDEDRFIIKFNNFWSIETPPGYSMLFTHPVNRTDLPFTTLTGLVDCDTFSDSLLNFPARWHNPDFNGVLPKGTPGAQVLPVKRESWAGRFETLSGEQAARITATRQELTSKTDVYRRQFRAVKR